MSFYTTLYFKAETLRPEYRAAIDKIRSAQGKLPREYEKFGPLQKIFPGLFPFVGEERVFQHPFFMEQRWDSILGGEANLQNGSDCAIDLLLQEGVTKDQASLTLQPAGMAPEMVIAASFNRGNRTAGLFLHWISFGARHVSTWVTHEDRMVEDGPYFRFEGEIMTPSDLEGFTAVAGEFKTLQPI